MVNPAGTLFGVPAFGVSLADSRAAQEAFSWCENLLGASTNSVNCGNAVWHFNGNHRFYFTDKAAAALFKLTYG